MSKQQPEFALQCQIAEFLRLQYPRVMFLSDVRASTKLTVQQASRSKKIQAADFAMPDMVIFEPRGMWHGMFLELKAGCPYRQDGMLRKDDHLKRQYRDIRVLQQRGYYAGFYWDFDQAVSAIRDYLK